MKSFVALIISLSLILVPCFAYADTATGSALSIDEQLWIMNEGGIKPVQVAAIESGAKAAGDPGTSTNPYYFLSVGRNATVYYATNSTSSSSTSYYVDDLGDVVQGISQSIAYSVQNQRNLWSTIGTNTVSAINDVWNRIGTLGGYVDGLEGQMTTNNTNLNSINTAVGNIKSKVDSIYSSIDNLEDYTDGVESSLSSILTAIQNQSLSIPQILIDNVQTMTNNQVPKSQFAWPSGFNTDFTINRYRQVADGGVSSDLTINPANGTILSRIWYWFANYSNSAVFAFRDLTSGVSPNTTKQYLNRNLQSVNLGRNSLWVDIRTLGVNINDAIMRLAYVLASDDEIAARQAAAANTQSAVNNFVSSSGSASVSTSNLGDLAGFTSSVTDNIVPGTASPTLLINTLNDDDVWSWFTQSTADALEPTNRLRNENKSSDTSVSHTPLLDNYYHDLEQALGVSYDR